MTRSPSPAAKRPRLDLHPDSVFDQSNQPVSLDTDEPIIDEEDLENNCSICLQPLENRTVIPPCSHEFCLECLLLWTEQSRRCPLCSQNIGDYLIHSIRSRYDYRKHFLAPLRPPPTLRSDSIRHVPRRHQTRRRDVRWGAQGRTEQVDKLERSIAKRRWIYQQDLYAKHVASNAFTKYRPYPTPVQFASSQDLISRTTTFLRRELQVWEGLDVEFLTSLIISLMKSIDIRSESAVKLISEFLDMDEPYSPGQRHQNAEHFAHEVYSYVRSPYKDLFVYDDVVQYDSSGDIGGVTPAPSSHESRWRRNSPDNHNSMSPRQHASQITQTSKPHRSISPSSDRRNLSPHRPSNTMGSTSYEKPATSTSERSSETHGRMQSSKGKERAIDRDSSLETGPSTSARDEIEAFKGELCQSNLVYPASDPRATSLVRSVKEHLSNNPSSSSDFACIGADQPCDPDPARQHGVGHHGITEANQNSPLLSDDILPTLLSQLSEPHSSKKDLNGPLFSLPTSSLSQTSELSIFGAAQRLKTTDSLDQSMMEEYPDSNHSTPSLTSLEARARLLARLTREKKLAQTSNVDLLAPHLTIENVDSEKNEAREASLRAKTQLRVRLDTEKRLESTSHLGPKS